MRGDHIFVIAPKLNNHYFEYMLQDFPLHEPKVFKIILIQGIKYKSQDNKGAGKYWLGLFTIF